MTTEKNKNHNVTDNAEGMTAPITPAVPDGEECVDFEAFYDGDRYKDDIFVCVNGARIQIKRGERVQIKRKYLEVIRSSEEQDRLTARAMESLAREFEEQSKNH